MCLLPRTRLEHNADQKKDVSMFNPEETQYEVLRRRGICRRDFLKFCSMAAVALGLGPMGHLEIAHAMETKLKAISLSFFLLHNSLILFITYDFSITNNITALFYN